MLIIRVNEFLQEVMQTLQIDSLSPKQAEKILSAGDFLAHSPQRPGINVRKLIRAGKIAGARQESNRRWHIDCVEEAV